MSNVKPWTLDGSDPREREARAGFQRSPDLDIYELFTFEECREALATIDALRTQLEGERLNSAQIHTSCHDERDTLRTALAEAQQQERERTKRFHALAEHLECGDIYEQAVGRDICAILEDKVLVEAQAARTKAGESC